MKKSMLMSALLFAFGAAYAADGDTTKTEAATKEAPSAEEAIMNLNGRVDGLNESYLETKATAEKLAKIKVSGYIQAQWQYADSMGVGSVAGGAFPANSQERFLLRRGRVKTTYETPTSKYVLQIDVTPTGVGIKDAYATIMEPWTKSLSYTMGVFDRPFGFEIGYSSSSREAPERSRVYQTLFPGERDLGAKLEIAPPATWGLAQYLNLKGGAFTGMGPTANENDNEKDLIGRAGFTAPLYDINLAIDGGFSAYVGTVTSLSDTLLSVQDTGGISNFIISKGNAKQNIDRKIFGVDAQVYYDIPVIGGMSLRGEYLWGEQPGTSGSSAFYNPAAATTPQVVSRNFAGWYVTYIQNLGTKLQALARYDVYDPNTDAKNTDIGAKGTKFNSTDIAYGTVGLGLIYHYDENVKFTGYYDMVTNEEVNAAATGALAPYKSDIADNVFTFRMQVKF